jgi:5-methylcytosine-specific restriction endonuclease McrA
MGTVRIFDVTERDRVNDERLEDVRRTYEEHREERQREYEDRLQRYDEYILSDEWRAKRMIVLARDRYRCQICESTSGLEVHHLTYAHLYAEHLFELVTLCARCHCDGYHQDARA